MARIRSIKPTFFTSEDICKRSPLARLLFEGLWCEADREGYLADNPFQLKTRILPSDDCDVDVLLWELASAAVADPLIRRYAAANGKHYIQILRFTDHQRPHPKEPKSVIPKEGANRIAPTAVADHGGPRMVPGSIPDAPVSESATASRDQVVMHSGSIPSSPVGREGDLESGVVGREGGHERPHRQALQGRGAFEAGSLPRDHMLHAICGAELRLCLKQWEFAELVRQHGAAEVVAKPVIQKFIDQLEAACIKQDRSPGGFKNIEREFQAHLKAIGRIGDQPVLSSAPATPTNSRHDEKVRAMESGVYGR